MKDIYITRMECLEKQVEDLRYDNSNLRRFLEHKQNEMDRVVRERESLKEKLATLTEEVAYKAHIDALERRIFYLKQERDSWKFEACSHEGRRGYEG